MKFLKTLLLFLSTTFVFGQEGIAPNYNRSNPGPTEERKTASDNFLARSGTLIEKRFYEVGKINKGLVVSVVKLKDLNKNEGFCFLKLESNDLIGIKEGKATLDEDEVDGFLKSLKLIKVTILSTRDTYTEVVYNSRGYFSAGAYYEEKKQRWKAFMQLQNYNNKTFMSLEVETIDALISLVEKAKEEMKIKI